uniref:Uncharacterized protein n=1 Tax=Brassica campestris TaxID=3711 RepID=A0A3P6BPP4_BRACM|nr:unnamed protein product [Brassica rapa]
MDPEKQPLLLWSRAGLCTMCLVLCPMWVLWLVQLLVVRSLNTLEEKGDLCLLIQTCTVTENALI